MRWYGGDIHNAQESNHNNDAGLYGWRQYGDYGIGLGNDLYPAYYIDKLLSYFARGGDTVLSAATDYNLLKSYVARRADGTLSLMVINKSPSYSLNGVFSLSGFTPLPNATVYRYGTPQDEAARKGVGSRDIAQISFNAANTSFTYAFSPIPSPSFLWLLPRRY